MRIATVALCFSALAISHGASAQMVALSRSSLPPTIQSKLKALDAAETRAAQVRARSGMKALILPAGGPDLQQARKDVADALLGLGYDLWSGPMFTQCITPKAVVLRPLPPSGHNIHNIYNIRQIDNVSEYHEDRSSGVNASITYDLVAFGGGYSEYNGKALKSTSKYLDVHIRYVGDEYAMNGGAPTVDAVNRLSSGSQAFAKVCGQQFISRVGFGVTLDGRMSAEVSINEKAKQNKADVSVGFSDLFGLSADSSTTVKNMSTKASLAAKIEGLGGAAPKPEDFVERVRTFGADNPAASSTEDVYIQTTPYSQVAFKVFRDFDDVAMQATGSVLALQSDRLAILQQRDDLEDAMSHLDFMKIAAPAPAGGGTPLSNDQLLKQQNDYLDALGAVWKTCRAALDQTGIDSCKAAVATSGPRPQRLDIQLKAQVTTP